MLYRIRRVSLVPYIEEFDVEALSPGQAVQKASAYEGFKGDVKPLGGDLNYDGIKDTFLSVVNFDNIKLSSLGLSLRVLGALQSALGDKATVSDLISRLGQNGLRQLRAGLLKLPGVGWKAVDEIIDALVARGAYFNLK